MRIIARLNVGGPAIHVILLTHYFRQIGYESDLVCGQIGAEEGDMSYLADSKNVHPIIIPQLGREISPWHDFFVLLKLVHLMRRYRPDIVHTHTAKAGLIGRIAAWLAGVPVRVHTFHGHVFYGYFSPIKSRIFIWLERFCARISSCIITISPKLQDELVNTYRIAPAEKFRTVSLGLDLQPLSRISRGGTRFRLEYELPPNKKIIGIVGRLVPIKNHRLFLEAAKRLVERRNDVHFAIIGDGECRVELEKQVHKLGLKEHISFVGWVEQIEMALSELDILALTSNNEGTPVSIIEAMAAGIPVVATDVGGVTDILENGKLGHIVPPGNTLLFANALEKVLNGDHPDVILAQKRALERFDIIRLVHDLDKQYREFLK